MKKSLFFISLVLAGRFSGCLSRSSAPAEPSPALGSLPVFDFSCRFQSWSSRARSWPRARFLESPASFVPVPIFRFGLHRRRPDAFSRPLSSLRFSHVRFGQLPLPESFLTSRFRFCRRTSVSCCQIRSFLRSSCWFSLRFSLGF
jgi:hypothetical protein